MNLKHILAVVLTLLMFFMLLGCSGKNARRDKSIPGDAVGEEFAGPSQEKEPGTGEKATVGSKESFEELTAQTLALTQAVENAELNMPLQPGDKLDVFIWDSPDLSQEVVIAPNGYFPFPLLNQVRAQGLTVTELQEKMVQMLSDGYLVSPSVKITVLKRRSRYFYVFGEVYRPQRIQYPSGEKINVLMAITMAGGLTDKASERKIQIIRQSNGKRKEISAKLQNEVHPGDIVIVHQALF
jgi:protein involved in polysaccharide export with SLBB domain